MKVNQNVIEEIDQTIISICKATRTEIGGGSALITLHIPNTVQALAALIEARAHMKN